MRLLGLRPDDRVAAHVVPAAGVHLDRACGGRNMRGSGIAHAALATADRAGGDVDLVIVAVPRGRGEWIADAITTEYPAIEAPAGTRFLPLVEGRAA
jgi:hypothetical protein